ncbi:enoyl-CoA hydratase/isomerase family protein [Aurantimonas sp. Leaf443]|uniref:enoyl-CoA hydratase/isomerase family protein n=1 Tax=Aurantimonas sp. Leaf443 TaxID=1736378 RepID=UPI0006FA4601|nr:enoyl-CoA hydratase/isomerase family protein [Aurantimonas sp. Leaf443]KQT88020.1 enoyl-CoA hydratase [Aurantimonas sp. Leaf443]
MSEPDVLVRVEGRAGRITLNRPKALNALNAAMVGPIMRALDDWRDDAGVDLVLIDASGERAFCAGGDLRQVYESTATAGFEPARRFWVEEYRLNRAIARYPKPYVAVMDGITMGGGVGLSAHGSHRIVTERSTLAMPECAIGLVPDVGGSLILATAPGRLGEFLGLTGWRMKAAEAIATGFADVEVPAERLEALKRTLCETGDPARIASFAVPPGPDRLAPLRSRIDAIFRAPTLREIVAGVEASAEPFAAEALSAIRAASPLSLAATLALVRTVRETPTIEAALGTEYRFTHRSQSEGDLQEGIRAVVIDKDRKPRWADALDGFDETKGAAMLRPLGADELQWEDTP